ncbi:MAG: hypothetical protein M1818_008489 [Claussenomyces sp. TS43310]|nr:MAG: hypothetical protein M1818_008489 [Claussenomyces sp. TS43310]
MKFLTRTARVYIIIFTLAILYYFHETIIAVASIKEIIPPTYDAKISESKFVEIVSSTDVDGPFDTTPLKELCSKKVPTPGLVFTCNKANGGIGNVRNQLLGCIRYAIEAGGGLVMPRPVVRAKNLIKTGTGITTDFEYFFDKKHFISVVKEACPNLKIYESEEGLNRLPDVLYPQTLGGEIVMGQIISEPEWWRERFDVWLSNQTRTIGMPTEQDPLLIEFDQTLLLRQPVNADGAQFRDTFGRILQHRTDIRQLAATTLYQLAQQFQIPLDPTASIHAEGYFGAHLRTEADALRAFGDADFNTQSDQYIEQARSANLSVLYVATGSPDELAKMAVKAWSQAGLNVTSKYQLLPPADAMYLKNMSWDQQALVDYEILLKASSFGGFVKSTFAWNIALRRHIVSKVDDPYPGNICFLDEFSHIYGEHDYKRRKNPWTATIPYAMWP